MAIAYLLSLNPTSYGIYRNLRGSGVEVHVFHKGGGLERFLGREAVIHRLAFDQEPAGVAARVIEVQAKSGQPGLVFTSSDAEILYLDGCRDELGRAVSLPIPSPGITRLVRDTYSFFERVTELGIASPRSLCAEGPAFDVACDSMRWPCLAKPAVSSEWKTPEAARALAGRKAFVVRSPEEYAPLIRRLRPFTSRLLVQDIVDVGDEGNFSFCAYSGRDGRVLWGFVTRKLLQYPEGFGTAILCSTAERPDVAEVGRKTVESLGIGGVSETEIVVDRRTGGLLVIEVNARHWLQHRLSTRLGVNISLLDLNYRLGNRPAVEATLSKPRAFRRVLWIDDLGYLQHFLKKFARGRNLYLKSLLSHLPEFALLESRSLLPFLKAVQTRMFA